jgi:hypothetical protein
MKTTTIAAATSHDVMIRTHAVLGPLPVGSFTPLLSSCCPPFDRPTLYTPTLSDCPMSSTLTSCCVDHRPIALQSVLHPPSLVMLFATHSPCITRHLLVSCSPPSILLRCPPPACLASSTASSCHVIHCPLPALHPSHTLPQLDCCIHPLVVPATLSSSIVEDSQLIVVCPPSPLAAATARHHFHYCPLAAVLQHHCQEPPLTAAADCPHHLVYCCVHC